MRQSVSPFASPKTRHALELRGDGGAFIDYSSCWCRHMWCVRHFPYRNAPVGIIGERQSRRPTSTITLTAEAIPSIPSDLTDGRLSMGLAPQRCDHERKHMVGQCTWCRVAPQKRCARAKLWRGSEPSDLLRTDRCCSSRTLHSLLHLYVLYSHFLHTCLPSLLRSYLSSVWEYSHP